MAEPASSSRSRQGATRAFPLFLELQKHSNPLFLRNSERKSASCFCWNCFKVQMPSPG